MKLKKLLSVMTAVIVAAAAVFVTLPVSAATEYSESGATVFTFNNTSVDVSKGDCKDYEIDGCELKITGSGTYVVKGTCGDGSITVKKGVTGVTLILDGLTLTSSSTAPIACNKSTEVTIVAKSGTVNSLTDNALNNDDEHPDNENAENAVIKCKDGSKVTICGDGTLNITANGKNGIKSGSTTDTEGEASLTIKELTLNITAPVNDAINAGATLDIESGNITVSAADDAIHSDYYLNIGAADSTGPNIKITACYEGLEAAELNIYSGNVEINSSDDGLNAANSNLSDYDFKMNIYGGSVTVYSSSGDGLDSNGSLSISGGTLIVWTANSADNQPLDAETAISISGGTVLAAGSSGGMGTSLNATQPTVTFGSSGMGMGGGMPGADRGNDSTAPEMPSGAPSGAPSDIPSGAPGNGGMGRPQGNGNDMETGDSTADGNTENYIGLSFTAPAENTAVQDTVAGGPQGGKGDMFGGRGGNMGGTKLVSSGGTFTITDSSGNTVYSGTAVYDIVSLVYSSSDVLSGGEYSLNAGGTAVSTATATTGTSGSAGGTNMPGRSDQTGTANGTDGTNTNTNTNTNANTIIWIVVSAAAAVVAVSAAAVVVVLVKNKSKNSITGINPNADGSENSADPDDKSGTE